MLKTSTGLKLATVSVAALVAYVPLASAKEVTITAVNSLQLTNTQTQSWLKTFVAPVNRRGKGIIQIKFLGGQEVVPPRKAAKAL